MAARGPLAVQGLHTCARSFSLPPLPAPLSPSRLARRRLKTPLLRPLKQPKLPPTPPLLRRTLLLKLLLLLPALLPLLPLLRILPRRCNFRFGELHGKLGAPGLVPRALFFARSGFGGVWSGRVESDPLQNCAWGGPPPSRLWRATSPFRGGVRGSRSSVGRGGLDRPGRRPRRSTPRPRSCGHNPRRPRCSTSGFGHG
jgi:hypothetical protein